MSVIDTVTLALKNIWTSKMRTFLTMLGIIIGVGAVIVIRGIGNGMQLYMEGEFAALGSNTVTVVLIGRNSTRQATEDDMYRILSENPDCLEYLTPYVSMQGTVKVGTEKLNGTEVDGVSEMYLDIKDFHIASGRNIEYMDIKDRRHVCVIGNYINKSYYNGNAVGDTIKVGSEKFTIIGVLEQEAADEDMDSGGTDDCMFIPYSTAARLSHLGTMNTYIYTTVNEEDASDAVHAIEESLFRVYGDDDAYTVISMAELMSTLTKLLNVVVTVLAIIAGISLVVGGVGIMNIMLVSVTERTREIGIRKALGAKESSIMAQFVIEAATTSALGGCIGIGCGYALCSIATKLVEIILEVNLVVTPSADAIVLAFCVSAGIGILFGYLPAKKAALLNPIDALRYE